MNTGDPLAGLRDIHLPPPVGWWPPAPGWWLLALLVLAGLGTTLYIVLRCRQRRAYRRAALRELAELRASGLEERRRLVELAGLLRRVAIEGCGREKVANLSGDAWLAFLDRTGNTDRFTKGVGRMLGTDLYRPGRSHDSEALLALVGEWIGRHKFRLSGSPAQTDKRVDETSRPAPKGYRPC